MSSEKGVVVLHEKGVVVLHEKGVVVLYEKVQGGRDLVLVQGMYRNSETAVRSAAASAAAMTEGFKVKAGLHQV